MGHGQEFIVWNTPGLRHGAACFLKWIGNYRGGGDALFFKKDSVEHTARAAGSSVADTGNDDVAVGSEFVYNLLVGRHPGIMFAPYDVAFSAVLALENIADLEQQDV